MRVNHHACLVLIDRADPAFLFANIALLGCIALLPFPTKLVAEHFRDNGARSGDHLRTEDHRRGDLLLARLVLRRNRTPLIGDFERRARVERAKAKGSLPLPYPT
jgi:hypothetical protein